MVQNHMIQTANLHFAGQEGIPPQPPPNLHPDVNNDIQMDQTLAFPPLLLCHAGYRLKGVFVGTTTRRAITIE